MTISRPACIGSTIETSKVRKKNHKIFAFKKFILQHCLDSVTPPRPNERDPNSRAVKMHGKEDKRKREEKGGKILGSHRKKQNKKQVCTHRFFRGDPCAVTFHGFNLKGVH